MGSENNSETVYKPGVCNIDKREASFRKKIAIFGVLYMVGTLIKFFHSPTIYKFLYFIPISFTIVFIQQGWFQFCVFKGIYGIARIGGKDVDINEEDKAAYLRADRRRVWKIIVSSTIIGLIISILYCLIPTG